MLNVSVESHTLWNANYMTTISKCAIVYKFHHASIPELLVLFNTLFCHSESSRMLTEVVLVQKKKKNYQKWNIAAGNE